MTKENNARAVSVIGITVVSLWVNILFVLIKAIVGVLGNSQALLADAAHSLSDFLSDGIIIAGITAAQRPIDNSHRYGHGKFETLSTAVLGIFLFIVSAGIFHSSSEVLWGIYNGNLPEQPSFWVLVAAAASIAAKEILFHVTIRYAEKNNSSSLRANAWHHRSDALSSVAVLIGSGCAYFFGSFWIVLDPAAGILVGIMVLKVAFEITKESIDELLEKSLGDNKEKEILDIIHTVSGVKFPHRLRTRKIGSGIAIDIHILVDQKLNIVDAHDIATQVETILLKKYGRDTIVSVHIEPDNEKERSLVENQPSEFLPED